jgi:hypothetical protein
MTPIIPPNPLTPSEIVILHGEKFVPRTRFTSVKLPHKDDKVSIDRLLKTMLAAAILVNEKEGVLALPMGHIETLKLIKRDTLLVRQAGPLLDWPEHSLEDAMCQQVALLQQDKVYEANQLVYGWLGKKLHNAWQYALQKVKMNLVSRGILETVKVKKLLIFPGTDYALSPTGREMLDQQAIEPVQQLLDDCQQGRPQVWKLLWAQIEYGFVRRGRIDVN